jgi:hypothetical protein
LEGGNPIQKVIALLGQLSDQIAKEGKAEAAEYDKFACFCKEQADDKLYNIEKSDKKIEELTAVIEKLTAEIEDLDQEIEDLGKKITEIEGEESSEKDKRKSDKEKYDEQDEKTKTAITAIEEAMVALQDSKKELKDAKVDLIKLHSTLSKKLSASQLQVVSGILGVQDGGKPGQPAAYNYQGNDIIDTLRELGRQFKDTKKQQDEDELASKFKSEKKLLGLLNERKFAEKAKAEKEELVATKTEQKSTAEDDKTTETENRDSDQSFLDELTEKCQSRAEQWDQRSTTRSGELTAIMEAKTALQGGATENYDKGNLAGLQQKSALKTITAVKEVKKVPSFIQLKASSSTVVASAVERLNTMATKLHSATLAAVAAQAKMAGGFDKVKELIGDLIKKLEEEAKNAEDAKAFCDEEMKKAVSSRDEQKLEAEKQETIIMEKEAETQKNTKEIMTLSEEIAELAKGLNEASKLRAMEKKDNEESVESAKAGKESVEEAIDVLKAFYDGSGFIQKSKGPDRDGKSVDDLMPNSGPEGDYNGKKDQAKGVIGLLEVVLSDFERTITSTEDSEKEAQDDYDKFEGDTKDSTKTKEDAKKEKEDDIVSADEAITSAKEALADAKKLHASNLEELEKLQAMCVNGEESFAERAKQREEEIKALKGAMKILEDWK